MTKQPVAASETTSNLVQGEMLTGDSVVASRKETKAVLALLRKTRELLESDATP